MYKLIKEAHSGIAYIVLLGLVVSTIYYFVRFASKKQLNPKEKTISLITMIAVHLQFLIGLILLFVSPITKSAFQDFGAAMKNDALRKQAIEHPVTMLIVVVLVTIANKKIKSSALQNSQLKVAAPVLYLVALALALAMNPWNI